MNIHYFGSTGLMWAVASTRQGVIDKLAKEHPDLLTAAKVKSTGGVYCWTCKVHANINAAYDIQFFKPVGIEISEGFECNIVNKNGSVKLVEPKSK